jgi:hypothetical protein
MMMKKLLQFFSLIPNMAAILAIACIIAPSAFGQDRDYRRQTSARDAREEQPPSEEHIVRVFKLAHSDAELMAQVLVQSIPGLNIAVDQRNNAFVARGTKEMLQTAEDLLNKLDTAGPSDRPHSSPVSVRVVWLVEGDESAAAPAENLKGVVEELRRQGLKNLGQVAQTVVRSQYGNMFHISCSPLLQNKPTMLTADGTIMPGGELEIRVASARPGGPEIPAGVPIGPENPAGMPGPGMPGMGMPGMGMPGAAMGPGGPFRQSSVEVGEKLIDLNVHTVFKPNDFIVLAVAPIGKITSVFVIQITESNP